MSAYYIASLKHTNKRHEHIVWWGHFHRGYTPVVGEYIGRYCYGEACELNDGQSYIAVPVEVVQGLMSPEPCYGSGARFYDQRGQVVNNTKANWKALLESRLLPEGPHAMSPKPEYFRGQTTSVAGSEHVHNV